MMKFIILLSLLTIIYAQRIKPNNTIILIPGIAGSILNTLDKSNNLTSRSWVTLFWQNQEIQKILTHYNKTNNKFDDNNYEVIIDYSDNGLYSIYNLDPDMKIFTGLVEYYRYLIDHLKDIGYVSGVNLFGLPYDWRYSTNRTIVLEQLHNILKKSNNNIIISHSMGGLLVENYIRLFGNNYINKWIPIAAPFKGVGGKIYEAYTIGYNLGNPMVDEATALELAYMLVSTYELFPQNYLTPEPLFGFKYKSNDSLQWIDPFILFKKLNSNFHPERYLKRNCFQTNVDTYYLSTSLLPTPHTTIYDYYYNTNQYEYIDGDETVPFISSMNAECHNQPKDRNINLEIASSHFNLIKNTKTIDLLDRLTNNECKIKGTYINDNKTLYISDDKTFYNIDGTIRSYQFNNYIIYRDCMNILNLLDGRTYNKISNKYKNVKSNNVKTININIENKNMDNIICVKGYKLKNNHCVIN